MKKILLILILLAYGCESKSQTGWTIINLGFRNYKSVNFINQYTGYIFGGDGTVFKTTNGGNNWILFINTGLTILKRGFFVSENFGYTFGNGIRKTINGGLNWISLGPINTKYLGIGNNRDMFFTNENTCFTAGSDTYPFPMPCCYDGIINKTINSGTNWSQVRRENFCEFTDIEFKDENTGCVLSNYFILRTTDAGETWNHQSDIIVYGLSMTNPFKDTIFIAGYPGDSGAVTRSIDGGNNWFISYRMRTNDFYKVNFINSITGYCVGNRGIIIKTTNTGENWTTLNSGTNKSLNDVYFINKDTGFVVGDSGIVLRTTTGGVLTNLSNTETEIPDRYFLSQNYPNPFNPITNLEFGISNLPARNNNSSENFNSGGEFVSLKVYDVLGNEVKTLVNEKRNAGNYSVTFDGANFSSGIYFYSLLVDGDIIDTKRMVLLK